MVHKQSLVVIFLCRSEAIFLFRAMYPRLVCLCSLPRVKNRLLFIKCLPIDMDIPKMFTTSPATDSGIKTGEITSLPSGLVGKEENVNGENLFSIQEGRAKVYFPSSSPEEVFYNPGILSY